jgi:glutathionylspermidine synthase
MEAGLVEAAHLQVNLSHIMSIQDTIKNWEAENFSQGFVSETGIPYDSLNGKQYLLGKTVSLDQTGCELDQNDFDTLSTDIATEIEKATNNLFVEEKSVLSELGYPIELIDIMKTSGSDLSYMRLSYIIDTSGKPKLIEVNSQTPSFNFELESGTDDALVILGKKPRNSLYLSNLLTSLKINLLICSEQIGKELANCTVGFLTCDSSEDIYQMNYLKRLIDQLGIVNKTEVCTNLTFDFRQSSGKPFNSGTETQFDILLNWYPLEFTHTNPYPDGSYFYDLLKKAVDLKQVVVYNSKSFIAQNKYLLVYMQENGMVGDAIMDYWTPSFYTQDEVEKVGIESWIGKPIWGRQGSGVFGKQMIDGRLIEFTGDMSDEYYTNQYYVYQQMWTCSPVIIDGIEYKSTLEKFVYKTNEGWKPGGQGMRISQESVIDNESSWLIVE